MKSFINGLIIAIAAYTKIPMPKVEHNRNNMKYPLCFAPLIGAVIGTLMYLWSGICLACGFGQVCFALVGAVIPVFVTGGVHLSGYRRTVDALQSDSTVMTVSYFFLYAAGLTLIWKKEQLYLLGLVYIISRTLDGLAVVWFKSAKKEGSLYSFSAMAGRQTVRIVLVTILALCFIGGVLVQPVIGAVTALAAMWIWTYYYYRTKNKFGGITEDAAGYFICLCELAGVLVIGMIGRVM